jgi:molybdate transport system substrate-binding protein
MRLLKLCAVICLFLAACSRGDERDNVKIYVAASLLDAVGAIGWEFEQQTDIAVHHSPGASSTLARQIADGAPAHVYFSASRKWVDYLTEHGKLEGEAHVFARNELVCVVPGGRPKFDGLEGLKDPAIKRIAIADEGVPAGDYARQALKNAGLYEELKGKLIGQSDVRGVVYAVQIAEADAGFVYATDALAYKEGVDVDFKLDAVLHDPIECYIAKVKGAPAHVDAYIKFMQGPAAKAKLKELGFRD